MGWGCEAENVHAKQPSNPRPRWVIKHHTCVLRSRRARLPAMSRRRSQFAFLGATLIKTSCIARGERRSTHHTSGAHVEGCCMNSSRGMWLYAVGQHQAAARTRAGPYSLLDRHCHPWQLEPTSGLSPSTASTSTVTSSNSGTFAGATCSEVHQCKRP